MDWHMSQWPVAGSPDRISGIELNQICDIADLAREDPDVIKLWIGEGDLPTPDFIREAAVASLAAGQTRYTYSHGVPALREALDRYHKRHWNVDIGADRFSVTAGGVQAIMQAFQAVLSPGDEVIVPVPAWPNLVEIVRILGGKVVPVNYRVAEGGGFRLDLDDIFAAVTPRTRVIAINSPSNPTGWTADHDTLRAILQLARDKGLWIIADEIYALFYYGGARAPSFLDVAAEDDRILYVNSFSKNWAMTGWRIGWVIFPSGMSTIFDNLSQYNTTSVATFIQHAAIAALDQGDDFIKALVARSAKGREIICSALDSLPNVRVFWPEGTFYFFFSVHGMNSGYDMARRILREAGVGVAPGSAFGRGGEAYLRVCFAVDPKLIQEGAHRLVDFLRKVA